MSEQEKYNAHIHAYALGCLDKDEYIELTEYLEGNSDFNWVELGEFQNLAALLPSFLQMEDPAASVKNKVAQRLYRLKEEKKLAQTPQPKPVAQPAPAAATFSPKPAPVFEAPQRHRSDSGSERPTQRTQVEMRSAEPGSERPVDAPSEDFRQDVPHLRIPEIPQEQQPKDDGGFHLNLDAIEEHIHEAEGQQDEPAQPLYRPEPQEEQQQEQPALQDSEFIHHQQAEPRQQIHSTPLLIQQAGAPSAPSDQPIIIKKGVPSSLFILLILVLAGAIYSVYYMLDQKITLYKNSVPSELTRITAEYDAKLDQVERQQKVLELLGQSDVLFIKLTPAAGSTAYGKLIVSPSLRQGQLIMNDLRIIPPQDQKVYQLWVKGARSNMLVPIEVSSSSTGYIPVSFTGDLSNEKSMTFLITRESVGTTPSAPSKEVELSGTIRISN